MEKESNEVYKQLIQSQAFSPCFYLHVLPDLKEQQFDFISHFPCFEVSPPLQFTMNDTAKGQVALQLDDYGQDPNPTSFVQNRITYEFYRLFHKLKHEAGVSLPHSVLLEVTLRQKKQFASRSLLVHITFPQLVHTPPSVCGASSPPSRIDSNGFTAESSRGHRIIRFKSDDSAVQKEAMEFNIQLMKWRLFPSLDVAVWVWCDG